MYSMLFVGTWYYWVEWSDVREWSGAVCECGVECGARVEWIDVLK